jgi:CubicO group peptidase (beta-lactamase class C family)
MNSSPRQPLPPPPYPVPGFRLIPPSLAASPQWKRGAALDAAIDAATAGGGIVGAVVLAARNGEIVYERAAGYADRESQRLAATQDRFRLASMTKAVVSAAALALMDAGRLRLEDPVTRWLPDFRPKLNGGVAPLITIRHLLTHTAGLGYGFLEPADGPYHQLSVSDGLDNSGVSLQQNLDRIASAPLLFAPGTGWHYSLATDVLGAVLERVTGSSLPQLVHELVTGPLGLADTSFSVSPGTVVATPYGDATPEPARMTAAFRLPFFGAEIDYAPARAFDASAFASGGVGLIGTALDYLRFLEAIRTGGGRVLRPETAAAMTRNAIGDLASAPGFGWGLGVQVLKDRTAAGSALSEGAWNWGGVYGTHFWVDPRERLSFVALTNTAVAGMVGAFPAALQRAVYGA